MKNYLDKINKKNIPLFIASLLIVFLFPFYNKTTEKYINTSLKHAAITYATARSINAAVSVIQNSSLSVGVGIEGNIAVGQALDPVNDATERLSDLLTVSIWTLGAEKIIYELSKLNVFNFLILSVSLFLLFYNSHLLKKFLIILLIIRFFLPFSALISHYFNKNYFMPNINKNIKILKPYSKKPQIKKTEKKTFWESISGRFEKTKNSFQDIQKDSKFYIANASKIISVLLNLASLYLSQFLLNTIFLPLLLIYLIKNIKSE